MTATFTRNLFYNAVQLGSNQLFGLLLFLVLSTKLDKSEFGALNWSLAVLLTVFSILSFGIDKMIVRKIAAGGNPSRLLGLYLKHSVFMSLLFIAALAFFYFFLPAFLRHPGILLMLAAGKLLLFFAMPFKQLSTGLENFRWLLHMSVYANIIKGIGILLLAVLSSLTLHATAVIFIIAEMTELAVCMIIARKYIRTSPGHGYRRLLRESLPQSGTDIFSSALSRADWILIGFFLTATHVADYSFAYKAFELSMLPLLAIAPLLLPLITRQTMTNNAGDEQRIWRILKIEIMGSCFFALCLFMFWIPVADTVTGGRYGASCAPTILLLSACMPLVYISNFLWTTHFAAGRLKMILRIFALTFLVNILANLVLIPAAGIEGAAFAYLLAMITQCILYMRHTVTGRVRETIKAFFQSAAFASGAGMLCWHLIPHPVTAGIAACILYLAATGLSNREVLPLLRRTARNFSLKATQVP